LSIYGVTSIFKTADLSESKAF